LSKVQILSKAAITPENQDCKTNLFQVSIYLHNFNKKPVQVFIKRVVELFGTILGLIIISPILVTIALAIKLETNGPVLYKQKRIGQHGKEFYMYKFRSMCLGADEKIDELKKYNQTNESMFKMFDDPRVTKVGKFLRKHSLDEFPQLLNVLKGEMSLVGFRPPLPCEVKQYKPVHYVRFTMMPGLTGPWQVNGRSSIKNFDKVIKLEYEYAKNWSLYNDLQILLKTIPVVIFGKNAA